MMEGPTVPVSVVIPCFRCATTIARAIGSIVQQTVKPMEILLVDDASGDGTLDVLQDMAQQHAGWIRVIALNDNRGAASARNAGWAIATQPYIAFLDADDSWHTEKLRIQHEYMQSNREVALCGHQCVWLRDSKTPPALPDNLHVTRVRPGCWLFKNAFSTPTVMLKRDVPFRFQEGKRCAEDWLLWQQIAFSGLEVARIESPLAYMHKAPYGEGGLSAQLWQMEQGELSNFVALYRAGSINWLLFVAATTFSVLKYAKRLFVTWVNRISRSDY